EICSVTVDCSGESDTYRRIDGRCNNLDNPLWGAAATTQPRFMDPVYKDEVSEPRLAVNGDELPSPRELSNILFKHDVPTPDERFDNTLMSLNWGQFLDHDFVLTPVLSDECMAITIPGDDEDMKNRTCMPFVRSSIAPNEDCNPGPKQVLNQLTSFIDASNVYGSSIDERDDLRFPSDSDARVNTQPGLAGLHLLFVMEHNRIVGKLREEDFPEEDLFEEARKIIGAFMQQITYGEYFSNVFNQATMQTYGLSLLNNGFANVYNASVDPGIRNAFATAAFRFGHSQIPDEIAYMLDDWNTLDDQTPMEDALLDPTMLITASGTRIPDLTRSMIGLKARRVDRFFEDSIRNTLFGSLDLPSLNIQRGRDHGLAPYIEWRRYCGLSVPTTFDELEDHNRQARNDLEGAYNNVTDIDLYAGAMLENRLTASYVGPTFACILGEQFRALKQGDRFWYENEGSTGFTVQVDRKPRGPVGIARNLKRSLRRNNSTDELREEIAIILMEATRRFIKRKMDQGEECMAIIIPDDDPHYNHRCMPQVRSSPAPNEDCGPGPKQVFNHLTSFIDASNVYGSTDDESGDLRYMFDVELMDHWISIVGTEMLPNASSGCILSDLEDACLKAGDFRVNTQPGLAGLHLLFVREHNRIVRELRAVNFPESDLFEEARKIIGALMQQITYGEDMLNVLNADTRALYELDLQRRGFANAYDPSVDPSIRNAFAAAALRFGHSQIPKEIAYLLHDWETPYNATALETVLLDPHMLVTESGAKIPDLTRYMINFSARKVDRFFESSIRNTLFGQLDLSSLNIQRGRDHGLAPYVEWVKYCNMEVPNNFSELTNHSQPARQKLEEAYDDVADIDLYVGAMTETRLFRSYVGPTMAWILGEQFRALKQGDRFWYENEGPTGFSPDQLTEIRKVKLSKILCDNFGIEEAQPNVFRQARGK
ncbi:hypothetical protein FSP39_009685, partial [Pinctada imbricata]